MQGPGGTAEFRIVARVVIPSLGDAQAVADGAILTGAGLDRVDEPSAELSHAWVVATTADHVDPRAIERRLARLPDVGDPETIGTEAPRLPLEVRRLQQVDNLPYFLAGFLALLGATAIGYTLATSVRRRRGELAVLKTLGFTRRQLGAMIAWQATTVACIGIVLGVPLGIIVGRLIWRTITDSAGVAFSPEVSIMFVVGAALAALLFANAVASLAGRAGRTRLARHRPASRVAHDGRRSRCSARSRASPTFLNGLSVFCRHIWFDPRRRSSHWFRTRRIGSSRTRSRTTHAGPAPNSVPVFVPLPDATMMREGR